MPIGLVLAVAVLGGAAVGVVTMLPWGDALAAAFAAAALAILPASRRAATPLGLLALAAAAAAYGAAARDRALAPPLLVWFDQAAGAADRLSEIVIIEGVIAADASIASVAAATGGASGGGDVFGSGARLVVDVERVRDATGWHRAPGRAQMHVAGALAAGHVREWSAGRRIRAPAALRRPHMLLNFGGPSPRWQRLRRPFALTGSIKSAALVEVERGAWWAEAAAGARWRARDAAARFMPRDPPEAAGVVTAILIGDRAGLDDETERRLQMAGTYHVIAISGGNVALLTALSYGLLRLVVRSPRGVALATMMVTLTYGAVVVGGPSVARAVTAACLYLVASASGLVPAPIATLRTAAVLLALADPLMIIDVGAWLSFGATFGILILATRLADLVPWLHMARWCRVWLRPVVVLVAATVAAEIILLPIAAAVFGRVTIAGLILNLVAIPAMSVVQIGGLAMVMAGPVWPSLAGTAAQISAWAANLLVSSSALVDVWPWLSWRVPIVSPWGIWVYYVAVLAALRLWIRAPVPQLHLHLARALVGVAGVTLLVIVLSPTVHLARPRAGVARIAILDVGQGDAILVQLPGGRALLVDAGGGPGAFDVGSRVVTPSVSALGVRGLTWLALTHGDRDHIGGAFGVTADLAPREIWEGVPVPRDPELARLRQRASAQGIAWRAVRAGARLEVGGLTIDTLHPPDPVWERQRVRNDDSLVLRLRFGAVEVLLTGDAGAEFEARLPDDLGAQAIRILKAGHHGSRTSTSDQLAQAMRPQVALVSVGRGNLFGHPAPDVIARLKALGAEVFRTDRDGAISLETDGMAVWIVTAVGRRLTIVAPPPPPES